MIDPDRSRSQQIQRTPKAASPELGHGVAGWVGRLIPFEWTTTRGTQVVVLVDRIRLH